MRCFLLLFLLALPAWAEEVDLELLLLVDVSRSMSPAELELQRRGYAEALRSDSVAAALNRSLTGRIALAYVEWAGEYRHNVVQDWALIESRADLDAFATTLEQQKTVTQSRTSISSALRHGVFLLETNRFEGMRRVIDISGDGPNNQGGLVTKARDEVLAAGIVINGLPLMTFDAGTAMWRIDDLDVYYAECVVGGPGAFVLPVRDWPDFAAAVTRKLVLEIAGVAPERLILAQASTPYDCLIGEKMWQRLRRNLDIP
ncbi:DUF1194 domain-containing protein [Defluviimonas sp. WL0050]|uniref:DUF1194 domain-containing protein n=1 Tax=Albidovulum litorale TaxID=2984134 RepID=A0ABT2ZIJ8_9RHOB|nr:DUF1194 domain-containing protein [Defluviimonas sp. WL0050]MCV2870962.1 DUF1194 domain-containing protein [Defluviimonas sp. WL0050]